MLEVASVAELELSLLDCRRCGEPMYHEVIGLSAHFPLCILWYVACGECGCEAQAWEDRPVPVRYGGGMRPSPAEVTPASDQESKEKIWQVEA